MLAEYALGDLKPFFVDLVLAYGNTDCRVFKRGIQNYEDFCLEIKYYYLDILIPHISLNAPLTELAPKEPKFPQIYPPKSLPLAIHSQTRICC